MLLYRWLELFGSIGLLVLLNLSLMLTILLDDGQNNLILVLDLLLLLIIVIDYASHMLNLADHLTVFLQSCLFSLNVVYILRNCILLKVVGVVVHAGTRIIVVYVHT